MISNEEHINNLVVNAYHRDLEIYSYQLNIDNYTAILAALPSDEWPTNISQWSNTELSNLPSNISDEDVDLISDYQYRDRLRTLLRTERAEQSKSRRVSDALKSQIGPDADQRILAYKNSLQQ